MNFGNSTEIDVPLPSYTRAFWSSVISMNSPGAAIGSLCLAVVWIWRHFVDQKKVSTSRRDQVVETDMPAIVPSESNSREDLEAPGASLCFSDCESGYDLASASTSRY